MPDDRAGARGGGGECGARAQADRRFLMPPIYPRVFLLNVNLSEG
jgi:hypothetical protein